MNNDELVTRRAQAIAEFSFCSAQDRNLISVKGNSFNNIKGKTLGNHGKVRVSQTPEPQRLKFDQSKATKYSKEN